MSTFLPLPKDNVKAKFVRRPQRFLAEMTLLDSTKIVAYCPNPGSMEEGIKEGSSALLWDSKNFKRKRRYTWRAVKVNNVWIGTDTHLSNQLIARCIEKKILPGFRGYEIIATEEKIARGTRADFLLKGRRGQCWVEVKSACVVKNGIARFPDSITPRGLKHLKVLTKKVKAGGRALLIFVVQRGDATKFMLNNERYPEYTKAFEAAILQGVEILALSFPMNSKGFKFPSVLPFMVGKGN